MVLLKTPISYSIIPVPADYEDKKVLQKSAYKLFITILQKQIIDIETRLLYAFPKGEIDNEKLSILVKNEKKIKSG